VDIEGATTYQYISGGKIQVVKGFEKPISADPLLQDFSLDLSQMRMG
jgi:hypothetical protein